MPKAYQRLKSIQRKLLPKVNSSIHIQDLDQSGLLSLDPILHAPYTQITSECRKEALGVLIFESEASSYLAALGILYAYSAVVWLYCLSICMLNHTEYVIFF